MALLLVYVYALYNLGPNTGIIVSDRPRATWVRRTEMYLVQCAVQCAADRSGMLNGIFMLCHVTTRSSCVRLCRILPHTVHAVWVKVQSFCSGDQLEKLHTCTSREFGVMAGQSQIYIIKSIRIYRLQVCFLKLYYVFIYWYFFSFKLALITIIRLHSTYFLLTPPQKKRI